MLKLAHSWVSRFILKVLDEVRPLPLCAHSHCHVETDLTHTSGKLVLHW